MRRSVMVALCIALGTGACANGEQSLGSLPQRFAVNGVPDLDGSPDIIVDAKALARSWLIRSEEVSQCSVDEGGVSPGVHTVLRFTATTPNVGTADVFVGDPLEHIAANDGTFEFATCHNHYHFRHYATYELISLSSGAVVQAAKRGFCMVDVKPAGGGDASGHGRRLYDACGTRTTTGFQGISVGWADSYNRVLDGQFFVLDESAAPVAPGEYVLRITVNPPFVCGSEDTSRPRDANGFCHMFAESDYTNNVGEATVTIPEDANRNASGPGLSDALSPEELAGIRTKTSQPHE